MGLGGISKHLAESEIGYAGAGQAIPRRMNTREALEQKKIYLEEQLRNVNNAIEALDQNPNVEKVLDLLSKV